MYDECIPELLRNKAYRPGGRLNIKMSSYQYMDSNGKDKTVSWPYYL